MTNLKDYGNLWEENGVTMSKLVYVKEDEFFSFIKKNKQYLPKTSSDSDNHRNRRYRKSVFNYHDGNDKIQAKTIRSCRGKQYLINKGFRNETS